MRTRLAGVISRLGSGSHHLTLIPGPATAPAGVGMVGCRRGCG